jgi:peptidoglycan/xylan/chitin deacetylase (PgdA/CDA1 family)
MNKISNVYLRHILIFCFVLGVIDTALSQDAKEFTNSTFLKKLKSDKSYTELKADIVASFAGTPAGRWGEFVTGVDEKLVTRKRIVAFTFDACGGKNGNGFDKELIDFLRDEKIPATLFVTGKWIDEQFDFFISLSRDTLFEIENHGLNHKPCSIKGESAYGIHGTATIEEAFDEIEANARKIEAITNHLPRFYRSATAFIDEACSSMAARLGITPISYLVLSGDAVPFAPASVIEENVVKKIVPGAIIIMHFNHPEWNTKEAMEKIVPKLRQMGYTFALLKDYELTSLQEREKVKKNLKADK